MKEILAAIMMGIFGFSAVSVVVGVFSSDMTLVMLAGFNMCASLWVRHLTQQDGPTNE